MAKAPPQRLDPSLLNYVGKGLKDTYENITRERAAKDAFNASANVTVFPGFEAYGVIRDLFFLLFFTEFEFSYSGNYTLMAQIYVCRVLLDRWASRLKTAKTTFSLLYW